MLQFDKTQFSGEFGDKQKIEGHCLTNSVMTYHIRSKISQILSRGEKVATFFSADRQRQNKQTRQSGVCSAPGESINTKPPI